MKKILGIILLVIGLIMIGSGIVIICNTPEPEVNPNVIRVENYKDNVIEYTNREDITSYYLMGYSNGNLSIVKESDIVGGVTSSSKSTSFELNEDVLIYYYESTITYKDNEEISREENVTKFNISEMSDYINNKYTPTYIELEDNKVSMIIITDISSIYLDDKEN